MVGNGPIPEDPFEKTSSDLSRHGDALLDNVPGKIRIGTQNELVDAASGKVDTVYLPQEGSAF